METKVILKVGLIAGLISAALPSVPTIYKLEYYKENWFWWYMIVVGAAMALLLMW